MRLPRGRPGTWRWSRCRRIRDRRKKWRPRCRATISIICTPWLDPENTLAFFYNAGDLPTSVLYDAQGREVWRMAGAHDWSATDSDALIAPAMP